MIGYEFTDNYKKMGKRLILYFKSPPFERPIRPEKYQEYLAILEQWDKNQTENQR